MDLVWPAAQYLPGYVHALQQGWSPDNLRPQAALDELARITEDPDRFLSEQVDRRISLVDVTDDELQAADAVVVLTDHDAFDYEALARARYVLDTRNRLKGDNVERL